jgi:hypothetical protein
MDEKRKQELIVRQSQLNTAISYFTLIGKKPTMVELIKTTTMMEHFIMNGYSKKMVEDMEKVDLHISNMK